MARNAVGEEDDLRGFEWYAYQAKCRGEEERVLRGHGAAVVGLAYDAASDRLASVGRDGTIRFWAMKTGEELATLPNARTGRPSLGP